jgi:hypothetical protein
MDVSGVGAGPQAANLGSALPGVAGSDRLRAALLAGTAPSAIDTFTSLLEKISAAEMAALLNTIERPESPQLGQRLDDLFRAAVTAINEGDKGRAIGHLAEFSALSPQRAETLGSLPLLSPMRAEVDRLLGHLSNTAKFDAEARLSQAVTLMETIGAKELVVREIRAEILILAASRLLEAGGYANAVRSAEVSQLLLDPALWAPNSVPVPLQFKDSDHRIEAENIVSPVSGGFLASIRVVADRLQLKSRTARLWSRAPLLVLLLAWFSVGLAGGALSALVRIYWPQALPGSLVSAGFDLWALGFLALVIFGFYTRVRRVRF